MELKQDQIENIANTVFCLMTGVYDLEVFNSPYNELVRDEMTNENGRAYDIFEKIYHNINTLNEKLNNIQGGNEEYNIFEQILSYADRVLEKKCIMSFIRGYRFALGKNCYFIKYKKNISAHKKLKKALKVIKDTFKDLDCEDCDAQNVLYILEKSLNHRLQILSEIAFLYGKKLADKELPIWFSQNL